MSDLISRQAMLEAIVNTVSEIGLHDNSEVARYGATFRQHEIIDIIERLPAAEPKRGEWEYHISYAYGCVNPEDAYCSCCGFHVDTTEIDFDDYHFCPNCGAKMVGGTE